MLHFCLLQVWFCLSHFNIFFVLNITVLFAFSIYFVRKLYSHKFVIHLKLLTCGFLHCIHEDQLFLVRLCYKLLPIQMLSKIIKIFVFLSFLVCCTMSRPIRNYLLMNCSLDVGNPGLVLDTAFCQSWRCRCYSA